MSHNMATVKPPFIYAISEYYTKRFDHAEVHVTTSEKSNPFKQ